MSIYVDIFSSTESGQREKEIKKVKMCVHIGFGPSTLQIQGVWLVLRKCVRVCVCAGFGLSSVQNERSVLLVLRKHSHNPTAQLQKAL